MNSVSIRKVVVSTFLFTSCALLSSLMQAQDATPIPSTSPSTTITVEDLKYDLELHLMELKARFERSKDYATDAQVIYRFKMLIEKTNYLIDRLNKVETEQQVLKLYELTIQTLNRTARVDEPFQPDVYIYDLALPYSDSVQQTPITPNNAQEKLDDAVSSFSVTNAEHLIQKTTQMATVQRAFLKTVANVYYNLAYACLMQQQEKINPELYKVYDSKNPDKDKRSDKGKPKLPSIPSVILSASKIGMNAFFDEIVPSQDSTAGQQWFELISSVAAAYALSKLIVADDKYLRSSTTDSLLLDILQVTTFTRFYLKSKHPIYKLVNTWAYLSNFINFDKAEFAGLAAGIENCVFNEGPGLLDKLDWPVILNKKSRRKAVILALSNIANALRKEFAPKDK